MLFVVEILLTITAWRKGWRGFALIPMITALGLGGFIGLAVGTSGGNVDNVTPVFLLGDLACIGFLVALSMRGPKGSEVRTGSSEPPSARFAPRPAEISEPRAERGIR
jgi:hypothetical protein